MQRRAPILEMQESVWRAVLDINLTRAFLTAREVARGMVSRQARKTISICSLMSEVGRVTISPYTAANGGLKMLTRAMAVEWAKYDIQVNAIGPGYFDTEMNTALVNDPRLDQWIRGRTPAGLLGPAGGAGGRGGVPLLGRLQLHHRADHLRGRGRARLAVAPLCTNVVSRRNPVLSRRSPRTGLGYNGAQHEHMRRGGPTMNRGWAVFALALAGAILVFAGLGCPAGGADGSSDGGLYDPYAALRAKVTYNGIICDEDSCCWWDCWWEQYVCGQQNGTFAPVGSTLDGFDLDSAPNWWREHRFYLMSDYEVNVQNGSLPAANPRVYYLGPYCGSDRYHTNYTYYRGFDDDAAFQTWLAAGPYASDCAYALGLCSGYCSPSCAGRQCGSDGCGGSCGTCPTGKICNASGQCVSDGSGGDPCWSCISSCRGLPGCCTGCGCICQHVCGMCW